MRKPAILLLALLAAACGTNDLADIPAATPEQDGTVSDGIPVKDPGERRRIGNGKVVIDLFQILRTV